MRIAEITDADIEAVVALWDRCGLLRPWNDPRADIALARRTPTSTVLVGWEDGLILAALMVGSDGHRGYVYYVGTEPDRQRGGRGRQIMAAAEAFVRAQGAPKLQLLVRDGNPATGFYERLGYGPEAVSVMSKRF
jgi:ribosomal protein S18 acetylase RimI-like enzyme